MNVTQAATPVAAPEMDQLCINTIRTLSIDAVQQAKSGHPGHPDGACAARLYDLESRDAFRSAGSDLAESRPLRAVERTRVHAAVVRPAFDENASRRMPNTKISVTRR